VLTSEEVAQCLVEAMRDERFHVLPHPEVADYVTRKATDVDRWIGGMQRWQRSLYSDDSHPATWLTGR